jgi:hypothetical protein
MQYESDTKVRNYFEIDHGYALLSNYFRSRKRIIIMMKVGVYSRYFLCESEFGDLLYS